MEKRINSLSGGGGIAQEKERRGRLFLLLCISRKSFLLPERMRY